MTRFTQVNLSELPSPEVIHTLSFEEIFDAYGAKFLELWNALRVLNPNLVEYDVDNLETDPAMVVGQAVSYRELLTRVRINDAAKAVMLAFAQGSDLDHLAALYGVERAEGELDARLRTRVQLAPEAFASAGPEGAYIFHAMTAAPSLRSVSAIQTTPGTVQVTCMGSVEFPEPSAGTLELVRQRLIDPMIKPLTDVVVVSAPEVIETDIVAELTLYPGPSEAVVLQAVTDAVAAFIEKTLYLGFDLKRSALFSRLHGEGVQAVNLISPAADINLNETQCFKVNSTTITVVGRDE